MKESYIKSIVLGARGAFLIVLSAYFFIFPFGRLLIDLNDPALSNGEIPRFTFRWHKELSPKIEDWANERVRLNAAQDLSVHDVSGTEWPIFSSVYYLWATEALQDAWEKDPTLSTVAPAEYAAEAIEATATLIADPNHANWVKQHWGDDYLTQENIFYRMLLMSGLLSYQNLTKDTQYKALLRWQVETLSAELEASPHGLLDDYPGQCYPIDILPAIAIIQRSEMVLNSDYAAFVDRSKRGFSGSRLDPQLQLPTYVANSISGEGLGPARGVGISYLLIWAPELWPEVAADWYAKYEAEFLDDRGWVVGVREYALTSEKSEWGFEIDAGPVMSGFGTAASAFGIGAARSNGRIDHAYPLITEALVFTWPLPNGTLLTTLPLSNFSEAPFIGETALLFTFTRQPQTADLIFPDSSHWPWATYLGLGFYLSFGNWGLLRGGKFISLALSSANNPKRLGRSGS